MVSVRVVFVVCLHVHVRLYVHVCVCGGGEGGWECVGYGCGCGCGCGCGRGCGCGWVRGYIHAFQGQHSYKSRPISYFKHVHLQSNKCLILIIRIPNTQTLRQTKAHMIEQRNFIKCYLIKT